MLCNKSIFNLYLTVLYITLVSTTIIFPVFYIIRKKAMPSKCKIAHPCDASCLVWVSVSLPELSLKLLLQLYDFSLNLGPLKNDRKRKQFISRKCLKSLKSSTAIFPFFSLYLSSLCVCVIWGTTFVCSTEAPVSSPCRMVFEVSQVERDGDPAPTLTCPYMCSLMWCYCVGGLWVCECDCAHPQVCTVG